MVRSMVVSVYKHLSSNLLILDIPYTLYLYFWLFWCDLNIRNERNDMKKSIIEKMVIFLKFEKFSSDLPEFSRFNFSMYLYFRWLYTDRLHLAWILLNGEWYRYKIHFLSESSLLSVYWETQKNKYRNHCLISIWSGAWEIRLLQWLRSSRNLRFFEILRLFVTL